MKTFKATVVSDKMTGSAVVSIDRAIRHPQYGKVVHRTSRLIVDNTVSAKTGDSVEIVPCRRLSKKKSHKILRVIK